MAIDTSDPVVSPAVSHARVLLVDDNDQVLYALCTYLGVARPGWSVATEIGVNEAMAVINRDDPYDLVVVDMQFPGAPEGGLDVVRAAHQRDELTGIIVLTGHDSSQYAFSSALQGACRYIVKGMAVPALATEFDDVIGKVRQARAVRNQLRVSPDPEEWRAHLDALLECAEAAGAIETYEGLVDDVKEPTDSEAVVTLTRGTLRLQRVFPLKRLADVGADFVGAHVVYRVWNLGAPSGSVFSYAGPTTEELADDWVSLSDADIARLDQ